MLLASLQESLLHELKLSGTPFVNVFLCVDLSSITHYEFSLAHHETTQHVCLTCSTLGVLGVFGVRDVGVLTLDLGDGDSD